eukprot:COSAG01_NODE_10918_length_2051_cov_1.422643_3_plen_171_part_00
MTSRRRRESLCTSLSTTRLRIRFFLATKLLRFRAQCSHMVFIRDFRILEKLKWMTEDMVPHVTLVVSGRTLDRTWESAFNSALRGAQVILMKNSGKVVDQIIRVVEAKQREATATEASSTAVEDADKSSFATDRQEDKRLGLEFPDSIQSSNFSEPLSPSRCARVHICTT